MDEKPQTPFWVKCFAVLAFVNFISQEARINDLEHQVTMLEWRK